MILFKSREWWEEVVNQRRYLHFFSFHLEKSILTTHSKRGSMGQVMFNLVSSSQELETKLNSAKHERLIFKKNIALLRIKSGYFNDLNFKN